MSHREPCEEGSDSIEIVIPDTASTEREGLRREILDNYLYPSIKSEFDDCTASIGRWKRAQGTFVILKYVCLIASPIVSFSTGVFGDKIVVLNFVAASLSSLGIGFDKLQSHCIQAINDETKKLNETLQKLNIDYQKDLIKTEDKKAS